MNLSLSGCGFLGIYHIGVASCFKEYAPHLVTGKIGGASAGAICACCFISGCCLGQCTSFILRLASKARSRSLGPLHPTFHVLNLVREGLKEILPSNAHEIASGRLFVSLTRVSDRKNVIVSQFDSVDELLDALICSAFVPFYCGLVPPTFKGVRYVDGGLTDNLLILDENTVTVSPFAGESDICPSDTSSNFLHITLANTSLQFTTSNLYRLSRALFPPHPEILSDMCKQGFDDALKFLQRNNLISCTRHLSIRTSITPVNCNYSEEDTVDGINICDDCDDADCHDCTRKKQMALIDSLPLTVVAALKAACESMEHGMLGYLWSTRPVKIASLLATPWVLPLDIMYNFCIRFLQWVPYMPQDIQLASGHLREAAKFLVHHINHHSRKYSAKFSCQVAISEVNYNQCESLIDMDDPDVSTYQPYPVVRNLNIGFAVNFETDSMDFPPSTSSALRQLEGKIDHLDIDKVDINSEGPGCSLSLHAEGQGLSGNNRRDNFLTCEDIFDTFENCLEVSHQMESIVAFHYNGKQRGGGGGSVNVREVFNLNDMDIKVPALKSSGENDPSELTWDNYLELEQEDALEISADDIDIGPIDFDVELSDADK